MTGLLALSEMALATVLLPHTTYLCDVMVLALMCVCMCICVGFHAHVYSALKSWRKASDSWKAPGVPGSCVLPDVGPGN